MDNSQNLVIMCSFPLPVAEAKCRVCEKKKCKIFCPGCAKTYCTPSCLMKEVEDHVRMCAWFWCLVDTCEKQRGSLNPIPCEGVAGKHICHGCHEIKQFKTKVCENCKNARYCSVKCQADDWKASHKKTCATLKTFRRNQRSNKKVLNSGVPQGNKTTVYWSIMKNGKSFPKKYQTEQEAQQVWARLENNKDGVFYSIGVHHQLLPASGGRQKRRHKHHH